jgi:SH3 domain protein
MANSGSQNTWVLIQDGVKECEKLLGQKEYNLSMIKARQTLEYMVKSLFKNVGEAGSDIELIDMIDILYKNKLISKTSCENYHKIRVIGNKAAHQNDANAYNANNAYSLLSQEVVTFSHTEFAGVPARPKTNTGRRKSGLGGGLGTRNLLRRSRAKGLSLNDIIKFSIPVLLIILLVVILRYCSKRSNNETLPVQPTTTQESSSETVAGEVESTTASESATTKIYVTTSNLNVRSAPSTDGPKLTTLAAGTEVEFVKTYDNEWSIIHYQGAQAYVSSKYIKAKEN